MDDLHNDDFYDDDFGEEEDDVELPADILSDMYPITGNLLKLNKEQFDAIFVDNDEYHVQMYTNKPYYDVFYVIEAGETRVETSTGMDYSYKNYYLLDRFRHYLN